MSDRHDSLDAAVTTYLTSKYFTELAPGTQRMRRNFSTPELENRVIRLASLAQSRGAPCINVLLGISAEHCG
jgi:hypothetical protein